MENLGINMDKQTYTERELVKNLELIRILEGIILKYFTIYFNIFNTI